MKLRFREAGVAEQQLSQQGTPGERSHAEARDCPVDELRQAGARPNYQNVNVPDRADWQTFWPLSYVFDFALA
jgi:hypothetical protein